VLLLVAVLDTWCLGVSFGVMLCRQVGRITQLQTKDCHLAWLNGGKVTYATQRHRDLCYESTISEKAGMGS
jgi:hypothetical protein